MPPDTTQIISTVGALKSNSCTHPVDSLLLLSSLVGSHTRSLPLGCGRVTDPGEHVGDHDAGRVKTAVTPRFTCPHHFSHELTYSCLTSGKHIRKSSQSNSQARARNATKDIIPSAASPPGVQSFARGTSDPVSCRFPIQQEEKPHKSGPRSVLRVPQSLRFLSSGSTAP